MKDSLRNKIRFTAGLVTGVLLMIIIPLVVLWLGLIDMSAAPGPWKIESVLAPWAFDRSMARRAPTEKNPFAEDKAALAPALGHFRENCLICHGVPGAPARDLASGLNPPAPSLLDDDVQELTDGETFWIIKNGIRMTGMPAFAETYEDDDVWKLVAFVKHLPKLTDEETSALATTSVDDTKHHGQ